MHFSKLVTANPEMMKIFLNSNPNSNDLSELLFDLIRDKQFDIHYFSLFNDVIDWMQDAESAKQTVRRFNSVLKWLSNIEKSVIFKSIVDLYLSEEIEDIFNSYLLKIKNATDEKTSSVDSLISENEYLFKELFGLTIQENKDESSKVNFIEELNKKISINYKDAVEYVHTFNRFLSISSKQTIQWIYSLFICLSKRFSFRLE